MSLTTATAKIIDLDPAQRLRRQTAEVMQKCSIEQIMDLLKDWEKIHRTAGRIEAEEEAAERFDRLFDDKTPPPGAA
jgi:hypothetical protein